MCAAGAALLTPSLLKAGKSQSKSSRKTNSVLILADDIGYGCFGCYGSKQYKTPNIDALASNGVRFTHCYAQPLCTPSRVKLMTGKSNICNYVDFSVMDKLVGRIVDVLRQYRLLDDTLIMFAGDNGRFARDKRWKLYGDGRLYDLSNDVLEEKPIPAGQGNKQAEQARKKLLAVIKSMPETPMKISKKVLRKKK